MRERAARGPATFTLLVPNAAHGLHKLVDPEDQGSRPRPSRRSSSRCRCSRQAAGGPVEGMIGVPEPLAAIQDAINIHGFDELIISTLPQRVSKWLKLDLPSKAAGLGLPVTTVIASSRERARWPNSLGGVSPFWIWMQVIIVICVVASFVIAIIKL